MLTFQLLDAGEVQRVGELLARGGWDDGRASAGPQALAVKHNEQLVDGAEQDQARAIVLAALDRSPLFLSAALPRKVLPPRFNRHGGAANHYGRHVDNAIRFEAGGLRVRTDLSCTVFLSDPASYDGGELHVHDAVGGRAVKLAAGHAVLYPGTSVHEVRPVTRGVRLACFFWVESMVRGNEERRLLHEFDGAITALRTQHGESSATVALVGTYHNLLRLWADS